MSRSRWFHFGRQWRLRSGVLKAREGVFCIFVIVAVWSRPAVGTLVLFVEPVQVIPLRAVDAQPGFGFFADFANRPLFLHLLNSPAPCAGAAGACAAVLAADAGAVVAVSNDMRSGPVGSSEYLLVVLSVYDSNCEAPDTIGDSRLGGVELLLSLPVVVAWLGPDSAPAIVLALAALACRPLKKEARKLGPEVDRASLFEVCTQPGPDVLLDAVVVFPPPLALPRKAEIITASHGIW